MSTQVLPAVPGGGSGTPASSVVSETTYNQSPAVGTSTAYARADHTHGTPPEGFSVVTTSTSPYNMAATTTTVFANPGAAQTVQLPAPGSVTPGKPYTVKRVNDSANAVTVTSASGTIDGIAGGTGIALAVSTYNSLTVQSDGTNWWVV
jgi:hypothetical protein